MADSVPGRQQRVTGGASMSQQASRRFGSCPTCGRHDGYLNVEQEHWFICRKHKHKWHAGSNLFSCWKDETPETWEKNLELLNGYTRVEPAHA